MPNLRKWLSTADYAAKYQIAYYKASELARIGKIPFKRKGKAVLMQDLPPPSKETPETPFGSLESLKARKTAYEILRLKQLQENERQQIKDEAINEFKAELATEIVKLLKELEVDILECVEDQEKQQAMKSVFIKFAEKLDNF